MTLIELVKELVLILNASTAGHKVIINGTHNWEYIDYIVVDRQGNVIINTTDSPK